jgi:hypothetical protein
MVEAEFHHGWWPCCFVVFGLVAYVAQVANVAQDGAVVQNVATCCFFVDKEPTQPQRATQRCPNPLYSALLTVAHNPVHRRPGIRKSNGLRIID